MAFCDPRTITRDVAGLLRPPEQISPSQAASRYLHIVKPGGGHGLYDPKVTPYSVKILDALRNRQADTVVFVAPAQTGKSAIVEGWLTYAALCAPGDMLIINPSEQISRDYSMRRIDRMLRESPQLRQAMSPRRDHDNRFDKHFRNGMILSMGHPAISQLSGRSLRYVAMSDYDRFPPNIDGEGAAVDLGRKRLTAYGSGGMLYVESSPGWDLRDGTWRAKTPHEAPPAPGILSEYNAGTRNRWYWECFDCGEPFEGDYHLLKWDNSPDLNIVQQSIRMVCPGCGSLIESRHKKELNARGWWRTEAELMGLPPQPATVDSYWLKGTAAAFVSWETLVLRMVKARSTYDRSGDENPIRTVTNTDLGLPYLPIMAQKARSAQDLIDNAESWAQGALPADDIRLCIATVDVQGNRFVASVHGYALRDDGIHTYCLHRQEIHWSERTDSEGRLLPLDPATHRQDWDSLLPLLDLEFTGQDKAIKPCMLLCDSGGRDGVTNTAYAWWRRLGVNRGRIRLVKGEGNAPFSKDTRPRVRETLAGGVHMGSKKRPDVPLLILNTNELKDLVSAEMDRLHLPDWLEDRVYEEIVSEARDEKGAWVKISRSARNEQADLLYYSRAGLIYLGVERWGSNWETLPASVGRAALDGQQAAKVFDTQSTPAEIGQSQISNPGVKSPSRQPLKSRKSSALTI